MAERVVRDIGAEVACIKISKQGGLSKARQMRDCLAERRMPMVVEDAWGGEIVTATLAQLAASTPSEMYVNTTDLHNYVEGTTGTPAPQTHAGCLVPSDRPGLRVGPDFDSLGKPVAIYQ